MRTALLLAVAWWMIPATATSQVDSLRRIPARLPPRVIGPHILRLDTTTIRVQRPVSRAVLETAWAAADTTRRPAATAVVRRPAWVGQAVLHQRIVRQQITDPGPRVAIAARRIQRPAGPPPTAAEDTTLREQRAADFRLRAEAVSRVAAVPATRLHPSIAANLISELDSVGAARLAAPPAAPADDPFEQEAYPEYVISLSRAVVRLKDPRSVRALTFGGLATSREVQRFVAAQGRAGLGALDTAFSVSDATAPAVVSTWGYTLAEAPSKLTFEDSVYVYARIVLSAQYYPVAFAYAARHAGLFDLIPELDSIATRAAADSAAALASAARVAGRALTHWADSLATPADWVARLRLRTGVLCMDETRLGPDACRGLLEATGAAARAGTDLAQVRQAMTQYLGLADQSVGAGTMNAGVREGLARVVNGLLRELGDTQAIAPPVRPDFRRRLVRPDLIRMAR